MTAGENDHDEEKSESTPTTLIQILSQGVPPSDSTFVPVQIAITSLVSRGFGSAVGLFLWCGSEPVWRITS